MFELSVDQIREKILQNGISKVVYFHCDHFEPWRDAWGAVSEHNVEDIYAFADATAKIDFARRLTLFYKCNNYMTMTRSADAVFADGDEIGIVRPNADQLRIGRMGISHLAHGSGHEIQLHYHHEFLTSNELYCKGPADTGAFFASGRNTPALDRARWKVGIQVALDTIRHEAEIPLEKWLFVHGMWALNASDKDVCSITNEIQLLSEAGCRGDFSFPAGRRHCDSRYDEPVFVRPVDAPKGYDLPEAEAVPAFGNRDAYTAGKFFIWASKIKAAGCSVDYYAEYVRKRIENVQAWAIELVDQSVIKDGVLFIKTHAHSMYADYYRGIRRPVFPHQHPGIQALLGLVFDGADKAGTKIEFLTASEVMDRYFGGTGELTAAQRGHASIPRPRVAVVAKAAAPKIAPPVPVAKETISAEDAKRREALFLDAAALYHKGAHADSFVAFGKLKALPAGPGPWQDDVDYHQIRNLTELQRQPEALAVAEQAVTRRPAGDALWHLHGVMELNAHKDLRALVSLKQAWRRQGGAAMYVAYRLAQILYRRRRYKLALEMAEFARDHGLKWEGLEPLLAEIHLGLGHGEACLDNLAASRTPIKGDYWAKVRNGARSMVANEFRHIAIGGASYTGSTVLGVTLGSLPGCGHIGESQELVFVTDTETGVYRRMDPKDSPEQLVHCRVCGPDCKVLSHAFRRDLAADPVDWYLKLARRMGVQTLISSDKFATQYQLADPLNRYDLIVVYRGLEGWVSSFRRQEDEKKKLGIPSLESPDPAMWLDTYALNYESLVNVVRPKGRRIVLSWEQFVAKPKQHFEHLIKLLGLPGDASVFDKIRIEHLIGGNDTAGVRNILETHRVQFKPSDAPPLSATDKAAIAAHLKARRMARMLDMLHAQSFDGVM